MVFSVQDVHIVELILRVGLEFRELCRIYQVVGTGVRISEDHRGRFCRTR